MCYYIVINTIYKKILSDQPCGFRGVSEEALRLWNQLPTEDFPKY